MKCTTPKCKGIVEIQTYKTVKYLKCDRCSYSFSDKTDELTIEYYLNHGGVINDSK